MSWVNFNGDLMATKPYKDIKILLSHTFGQKIMQIMLIIAIEVYATEPGEQAGQISWNNLTFHSTTLLLYFILAPFIAVNDLSVPWL